METKQAEACVMPTISISYSVLDDLKIYTDSLELLETGEECKPRRHTETFVFSHPRIIECTVIGFICEDIGYDFQSEGPFHIDLSQPTVVESGEVYYSLELNNLVDADVFNRLFKMAMASSMTKSDMLTLYNLQETDHQTYRNAFKVLDAIWANSKIKLYFSTEWVGFGGGFNGNAYGFYADDEYDREYRDEDENTDYEWISNGNNLVRMGRGQRERADRQYDDPFYLEDPADIDARERDVEQEEYEKYLKLLEQDRLGGE